MDKDRFAKEPSKTLGSRSIVVRQEFLSDYYSEPSVSADARSTATGYLELLRIEPKRTQTNMPAFSVRWDHKDDSVDVDLVSSNEEESHRFKARKSGYRGHKTCRLDQPSRTHTIEIETPATGVVFKGTITLNLDLAESIKFGVSTRVECTAELIRDGKMVDEGNKCSGKN